MAALARERLGKPPHGYVQAALFVGVEAPIRTPLESPPLRSTLREPARPYVDIAG
jgi:hypothetical protein